MKATREEVRPHRRPPVNRAQARRAEQQAAAPHTGVAPVVAAVEPRKARVSADTAARMARQLGAPLIFISVRPRRPAMLGDRHSEREWVRDMLQSRKALDVALFTASRKGVMAYGEILEGDGAAIEFAKARSAQLLVKAGGAIHPCPAS